MSLSAESSVSRSPALLHHWTEFFRGGEAVLEQFCLLFPQAPVSILTYETKALSPVMARHTYHTGWIHRFPKLRKHFRSLLPFFPEMIQSVCVPKGTRFVLSSDAAMIKGASLPNHCLQVCYCHSPPRYVWEMGDAYTDSKTMSRFARRVFNASLPRLRRFDYEAAQRVDAFIANSACVRDRIQRYYGRESVVIHPPVHVNRFNANRPREDFFLIVSALVPYKRLDLAVDACTRLNRRLVVIGTGPEETHLRGRAGATVQLLGWQSNDAVKDHYERCRAFLFPGIEDFGITPCEAQSAGAPVIAFGEGGALETVRDGVSGIFFHAQTVDAVCDAIDRFESLTFPAAACRANVAHLGPERFRQEIREFLATTFPEIFSDHVWPEDDTPVPATELMMAMRDTKSSRGREIAYDGFETNAQPSDPKLTVIEASGQRDRPESEGLGGSRGLERSVSYSGETVLRQPHAENRRLAPPGASFPQSSGRGTFDPPSVDLPSVAILCAFYFRDSVMFAEEAMASLIGQDYPRELIHIYLYVDGPVGAEHEAFLGRHAKGVHRLVRHDVNRGLPFGLNALLELVGEEKYIFRMDLDDIALRSRVRRQVEFMESHPEVDLLGCNSFEIADDGGVIIERNYPEMHGQIVRSLTRCNPMLHPTYCLRASTWKKRPILYRPLYLNEDLGFLFDVVPAGWRLHNLQERLFKWRTGSGFFARRGFRRARVELHVYLQGIYSLHGLSPRLVWPFCRFGLRLLPNALTRFAYRSRLRQWILHDKARSPARVSPVPVAKLPVLTAKPTRLRAPRG